MTSKAQIASDMYEMIGRADGNAPLQYEDAIADLCYHMKYQYVGHGPKDDADPLVPILN